MESFDIKVQFNENNDSIDLIVPLIEFEGKAVIVNNAEKENFRF